ncbi:MAG: hypothetical protein H8Z69_02415 [Nanohaloarchaea archaeon]|nr:hypothetical protein [Candidatus Nanohaloarchaea archaeon]
MSDPEDENWDEDENTHEETKVTEETTIEKDRTTEDTNEEYLPNRREVLQTGLGALGAATGVGVVGFGILEATDGDGAAINWKSEQLGGGAGGDGNQTGNGTGSNQSTPQDTGAGARVPPEPLANRGCDLAVELDWVQGLRGQYERLGDLNLDQYETWPSDTLPGDGLMVDSDEEYVFLVDRDPHNTDVLGEEEVLLSDGRGNYEPVEQEIYQDALQNPEVVGALYECDG